MKQCYAPPVAHPPAAIDDGLAHVGDAAPAGPEKPGHHPEEGRLSGSVGPRDRGDGARGDIELGLEIEDLIPLRHVRGVLEIPTDETQLALEKTVRFEAPVEELEGGRGSRQHQECGGDQREERVGA